LAFSLPFCLIKTRKSQDIAALFDAAVTPFMVQVLAPAAAQHGVAILQLTLSTQETGGTNGPTITSKQQRQSAGRW
jgi:hypothetical protein